MSEIIRPIVLLNVLSIDPMHLPVQRRTRMFELQTLEKIRTIFFNEDFSELCFDDPTSLLSVIMKTLKSGSFRAPPGRDICEEWESN